MNRKLFVWTALMFAAVLLFASCDKNALEAPKPKVEDEIKGHDEWNKIKLVMRMGKMSADNKFVEAYDESYQNVIPVKQVIEIGRAAGGTGSVQIQSALKEFQVIKGSNVVLRSQRQADERTILYLSGQKGVTDAAHTPAFFYDQR